MYIIIYVKYAKHDERYDINYIMRKIMSWNRDQRHELILIDDYKNHMHVDINGIEIAFYVILTLLKSYDLQYLNNKKIMSSHMA